MDIDVKDVTGPYDAKANGSCACHGAPVNQSGRCEPLNMSEYPNAETAKLNDATRVRYAPPAVNDAEITA